MNESRRVEMNMSEINKEYSYGKTRRRWMATLRMTGDTPGWALDWRGIIGKGLADDYIYIYIYLPGRNTAVRLHDWTLSALRDVNEILHT